jgi:hypothetical protein
MLVLNYDYNTYDEINVQDLYDGNSTDSNDINDIGVILGATIGGILVFVIILVIIIHCCFCRNKIDEDYEIEINNID